MECKESKGYTLITGVTSGIGRALSWEFARHGHALILVGRRQDALDGLRARLLDRYPGGSFAVVCQDLAAEDAGEKLYHRVREMGLTVENLVNNAGIGFVGPYEAVPLASYREMLRLNIQTLSVLCCLFLPMLRQRKGHILNVASNGAFHPGPYTAAYYASKAYVLHLSQALRAENRGWVHVTTLCPGATVSDFCRKAGKAQLPGSMSAQRVAVAAYKGMKKGRAVVVPGFFNNLSLLVPRPIRSMIVGRTQKRLWEQGC